MSDELIGAETRLAEVASAFSVHVLAIATILGKTPEEVENMTLLEIRTALTRYVVGA